MSRRLLEVSAAERRQNIATADRPWWRNKISQQAAVAAKDSYAATAAYGFYFLRSTACGRGYGLTPLRG